MKDQDEWMDGWAYAARHVATVIRATGNLYVAAQKVWGLHYASTGITTRDLGYRAGLRAAFGW